VYVKLKSNKQMSQTCTLNCKYIGLNYDLISSSSRVVYNVYHCTLHWYSLLWWSTFWGVLIEVVATPLNGSPHQLIAATGGGDKWIHSLLTYYTWCQASAGILDLSCYHVWVSRDGPPLNNMAHVWSVAVIMYCCIYYYYCYWQCILLLNNVCKCTTGTRVPRI